MSIRSDLLFGLAAAVACALPLSAGAQADVVTFDTTFEVSDVFEGTSSVVDSAGNLSIDFDSGRVGFASAALPRFDSNLGVLNSVTLAVEFDLSTVNLPISLSSTSGGTLPIGIDELSLQRGIVFGVNTGFIRPQVISSATQTLDQETLEANGLLAGNLPSSFEIDIPTTGPVGFIPDDDLNVINGELSSIDADGNPVTFSFTGTDDFGFVFRRINQLIVNPNQDNVELLVAGGRIDYAGTVSVTYAFTAVPEPTSLVLLGSVGLLLLTRRRRES